MDRTVGVGVRRRLQKLLQVSMLSGSFVGVVKASMTPTSPSRRPVHPTPSRCGHRACPRLVTCVRRWLLTAEIRARTGRTTLMGRATRSAGRLTESTRSHTSLSVSLSQTSLKRSQLAVL